MRAFLAFSLALLVFAAAPAGAGAKTFGADLGAAPNVSFDCTVTPPVAGFQVSSGAQTCTWWTTGRISDQSQGHIVPSGGGTITRARVRVGPVTGPMQFVVMRSLRHPQSLADPACCFPVGSSQVFTPKANGVTEVPMNVPTRNETDKASGINNFDHIALSVLAPGVPIPARSTGDDTTGGGFYPHYTPGTERTTGLFGIVGFQTLINADIDQSTPGTGTPTGPNDVSGTNPIALGGPVRVRGGKALVPLVCSSPQECAGVIRLQNRGLGDAAAAARKKRKRKRARTYGKAGFRIPAGKTTIVKVRLNRAGKRLVRKRKRAQVFANVTLKSKRTSSMRTSLRRK
jgi:hypothetical protein